MVEVEWRKQPRCLCGGVLQDRNVVQLRALPARVGREERSTGSDFSGIIGNRYIVMTESI